jgi:chemosensory pili system protein ChpC
MRAELTTAAEVNELATLLIPVTGKQLVLPNVTVAEIISYVEPVAELGKPEWYLGKFLWRNISVPLVSFEGLNQEPVAGQHRERRIAVLNGLVNNQLLPFCGIVADGVPRLMRVMSDELSDEEAQAGPAELVRVLVSGEPAVIPNVDFIQQEILQVI